MLLSAHLITYFPFIIAIMQRGHPLPIIGGKLQNYTVLHPCADVEYKVCLKAYNMLTYRGCIPSGGNKKGLEPYFLLVTRYNKGLSGSPSISTDPGRQPQVLIPST
jgi:hypothetical protein